MTKHALLLIAPSPIIIPALHYSSDIQDKKTKTKAKILNLQIVSDFL